MLRIKSVVVVSALMMGVAVAGGHLPHEKKAGIVKERVAKFKQNEKDIKAIFRTHLRAKDFAAIEMAAGRIADFADEMPRYFPKGSHSPGAHKDIWEDMDDFTEKAAANATAARKVIAAAQAGDARAVGKAARRMGKTCKSCHEAYRIKK